MGVFIKLGSRHEPDSIKGASHFIEHMLFKGTEQRSAREIAESFETIGGQLNAYTAKEYTCIYARTLDEDIYLALDIIFDMLFNSRFAPRDFETEKGVIMEEINMYEDNPDDLIHDIFARKMWQAHPMGSPILGTLDSVGSFERGQIDAFYRAHYLPSNMIISLAGNIDSQRIRDTVEGYLASRAQQDVEVPQEGPGDYQPFVDLVEKPTEQVQICLGVPGISYKEESRHIQNVMNSILGGGMSSRLFQSLREELGLAYSVYSYPSNYSDTGSYSIYIGTGPGKINTCFEALFTEIRRFVEQGVSEEELQRTRKLIKSSLYLGLENVMNRMSRLGKSLLMYERISSPEDIIERIERVSAEDIRNFAGGLLQPGRFSVAAIAPAPVLTEVNREYEKNLYL